MISFHDFTASGNAAGIFRNDAVLSFRAGATALHAAVISSRGVVISSHDAATTFNDGIIATSDCRILPISGFSTLSIGSLNK